MAGHPVSERASAELRATCENIPGRGPEAVEQLTPQEPQIARLAPPGLSNREIGAQLGQLLARRSTSEPMDALRAL